jgi:hypothetical protein
VGATGLGVEMTMSGIKMFYTQRKREGGP